MAQNHEFLGQTCKQNMNNKMHSPVTSLSLHISRTTNRALSQRRRELNQGARRRRVAIAKGEIKAK